MKIAQLAPVWFPVPPSGYGGIELVVSLLADGLAANGHDVTLFAAGGSRTTATLVTPLEVPPDPSTLGDVWSDTFHVLSSYLSIVKDGDFDVVHDHSGIIGPAMGALLGSHPPVVHTLHGPWTESGHRLYGLVSELIHLVAVAETQRADNPDVRYAGTVYNGIDLSSYEYREEKDDYLVFIGRANPDKGLLGAIEAAHRLDLPLKMIVKKNEPAEQAYWGEYVIPRLTASVEVFEHIPHQQKVDLLSHARAMVFPIQWQEPFGLVMVEAMACGTPVIAGRWGAATEVVDEGVTGFLTGTVEDIVDAYAKIGDISPAACRQRVEENFSTATMIAGYEEIFARIT